MTATLPTAPRRRGAATRDRARPPSRAERAGRPTRAGCARAARLLGDHGVLYLWDLGASGWANAFYSAAVQAGSESWKAFFFGSSDAAQLDHRRQAAGLAVGDGAVGAAVRAVSSWAILVPQALMGVAHGRRCSYATVRRWFGAGRRAARRRGAGADPGRGADVPVQQPGRAAGAADDRGGVRADCGRSRTGRTRWLVLAGVLVGFGFLTKMLQALLVVPRASRWSTWSRRRRRLGAGSRHLLAARARDGGRRPAGGSRSSSCGRPRRGPYIGGSQNNSILELTLGYNGLGRLTGDETGSVGGGAGGLAGGPRRHVGADRLSRLFDAEHRRPDRLAAAGGADPAASPGSW